MPIDWDTINGTAGAAPSSGTNWDKVNAAGSTAPSIDWDKVNAGAAAPAAPAPHGGMTTGQAGGGVFGWLGRLGSALGGGTKSMLASPAGMIGGTASMLKELPTAMGVDPEHLRQNMEFWKGRTGAQGQGWQAFQKQAPQAAGMITSTEQGLRNIDPVEAGYALATHPGNAWERLASTRLGENVHQQGVLGAGLNTAGGLMALGGGIEGVGGIAGNEGLVAAGRGMRTLGAKSLGAPAEIYTKGIPAVARAIPGVSRLAETAAAAARTAAENSPRLQAFREGRRVKANLKVAAGEELGTKQATMNQDLNKSFKVATDAVPPPEGRFSRLFGRANKAAEGATILLRVGAPQAAEAALAGLPEDILSKTVGSTGVTVEQHNLAMAHLHGEAPAEVSAGINTAGSALEQGAYGPKQERYLTGQGESTRPNEAELAQRRAGVERPNEALPGVLKAAIEKLDAPLRELAAKHQGAIDDAINRSLSDTAPLSIAQIMRQAGLDAVAAKLDALTAAHPELETPARRAATVASRESTHAPNVAQGAQFRQAERTVTGEARTIAGVERRREAIPGEQAANPALLPPATTKLLRIMDAWRTSLLAQADEFDRAAQFGDRAKIHENMAQAADLRRRAGLLPKSGAELDAIGVEAKYVPAGPEPTGRRGPARNQGTATMGRTKLSSQRQATGTSIPLTFKGQKAALLGETRGVAKNEYAAAMAPRITEETGVTRVSDLFGEHPELRNLKGADLQAALRTLSHGDYGDWHAWDPEGTGRRITGEDVNKIGPNTRVAPTAYMAGIERRIGPAEAAPGEKPLPVTHEQQVKNILGAMGQKALSVGRVTRLLTPGWQFAKMFGDPAMFAAAGVNPIAALKAHGAEALRAMRSGDLTPGLGSSAEGKLGRAPATNAASRAGRGALNVIFTPFEQSDLLAREVFYRERLAAGLSAEDARVATKRALGDLHGEKNAAWTRGATFWPWQKHIMTVMARAPLEHPAGVLRMAQVGQVNKQTNPNDPFAALAGRIANPMGSSIAARVAAAPTVSTAVGTINPAIRAGVAGVLGRGTNLNPITTPTGPAGLGFGLAHPGQFAQFMGQQVPLISGARNAINAAPAPGGKVPMRYGTGQPQPTVKGGRTLKPATFGARTRGQALAEMLGLAPPAPTPKKGARGSRKH